MTGCTLKELHILARTFPYDEFASIVARRFKGIPRSVDSSGYTDDLNLVPRNE